jgi:hypothetical protein
MAINLGIFCHRISFIKYNNLVRWAGIATEVHHSKKTTQEYKNRMRTKNFLMLMSLRFPCSTNSNSSKVFDFGPHHINSTIITSIELQNSWLVQLWTALSKEYQKASSLHIPGIVLHSFICIKTSHFLTSFSLFTWHDCRNFKNELEETKHKRLKRGESKSADN